MSGSFVEYGVLAKVCFPSLGYREFSFSSSKSVLIDIC